MKKSGMTLIELMVGILIIGIITSIAVLRINLIEDAKKSACDGNLTVINAALYAYYAKTAVGGTAEFPSSLTVATFADGYFLDATLPRCPFDVGYVYNSTAGKANKHSH